MSDNPRCPLCRIELVPGEDKRYETLSEHVMDPNGESPPRPTLVCSNGECVISGKGFWSLPPDGGWYSERYWITNNIPDLEGCEYGPEESTGEPSVQHSSDFWRESWKKEQIAHNKTKRELAKERTARGKDMLPLSETPERIRKLLKPGELAPRNVLFVAEKLEPTEKDIEWAKKEMKEGE